MAEAAIIHQHVACPKCGAMLQRPSASEFNSFSEYVANMLLPQTVKCPKIEHGYDSCDWEGTAVFVRRSV